MKVTSVALKRLSERDLRQAEAKAHLLGDSAEFVWRICGEIRRLRDENATVLKDERERCATLAEYFTCSRPRESYCPNSPQHKAQSKKHGAQIAAAIRRVEWEAEND